MSLALIISHKMEQIKMFKQGGKKLDQSIHKYQFEDILNMKIGKNKEQREEIEPWLQQSDRNPFLSLKSQRIKKVSSPRIKRKQSLPITTNWKSIERNFSKRQSKILPVMDVGQYNQIRKNSSPGKIKSKLDLNLPSVNTLQRTHSSVEVALPSVKRQLSLERKLFLMKNASAFEIRTSPQRILRR